MTLSSPFTQALNVMVVDNEVCFLQLMRRLLSRDGIEPTCVESISEAHTALSAGSLQHWDLLVVDLNLPDGDGITFTHTVRENGFTGCLLLCSGSLAPTLRDRALAAGADGLLTKPFSIEDFRQWLETAKEKASGSPKEECLWAS